MEKHQSNKGITKRTENYSEWYHDVIEAGDLAEHAPVKGCMVIKPYGYAIWENMQKILDAKIKETGHKNAYFPLFIPKSLLNQETQHVQGFAKECAVVTHYRLKTDQESGELVVDEDARLEEELIVRPTSETIIYSTFAKWIHSWRDLPILINQWANVVRWEMRTRLFLRTTEFLWQEGHTAHEREEEAEEEALKMLQVYTDFVEKYLCIPVVAGKKTELEKFPGALRTYSIEALMQDGRALQTGTSHNLGQNFAKAFGVKFTDRDGRIQYVWQTSWGVSTRLMGALVMAHSDDYGFVVPPKIAPIPVVIVPIWRHDDEKGDILVVCDRISAELHDRGIAVTVDWRDYFSPGVKFNEWEKKGIPLRIEIGPRDIAENQVVVVRRDTRLKENVSQKGLSAFISQTLDEMHEALFKKAQDFRSEHTHEVSLYDDFKRILEQTPGFLYAYWCGESSCEEEIVRDTKATIRCIPLKNTHGVGTCIRCGTASAMKVIFAKAY